MATPITGFPDASSSGVPAGTPLTAYTGPMTITKAGTVIEGKIIDGSLRITASDVVIKNCIIKYNGWWGIDAEGAKNIIVQNCDIIGPGYNGDSNAGILGSGTFIGNDISKSENGIVLTGGASTVKGNFIHDLQDGTKDPHYDGIAVQGGQNGVLIEGNTVIGRDTSDIFIKNDFGPISNVTVKGNLLLGDAGYTIYVDARASGGPISGVTITGNHVEKGFYGYYSVDKSSPVISGNIEYLNGQAPVPGGGVPTPAPGPGTPTVDKIVDGNNFANTLFGGDGNDVVTGYGGRDVMTGGLGADIFKFTKVSDTGSGFNRDIITDFKKGVDKIDLSVIDANGSARGNTAFHFISPANALFDRAKGALAWHLEDKPGTANDITVIQGDINGDGVHDFEIQLKGLVNLSAQDFIL